MEELDQAVFGKFWTDGHVGAACPASAENAGVGGEASGGENADSGCGHLGGLAQPGSHRLEQLAKLRISELPFADRQSEVCGGADRAFVKAVCEIEIHGRSFCCKQ